MDRKILVAKSYQNLPFVSEPYMVNGREYIKVRLKNGSIKAVRSYTPAEYKKYNPEVKIIQPAKSQRDIFGFGEAGYIWLFKGDTYGALNWFREQPTRYNTFFGWYLPSNIEMPLPLPINVTPVHLFWDDIKDPTDENKMRDQKEVRKYVETLIYDSGVSQWAGAEGDKITFEAVCDKKVEVQSAYGLSTIYNFTDASGNKYSWTTSTSPGIMEGNKYEITGKIKKLDTYRNNKITVLTRAKVNAEIEPWGNEE